MEFYFTCGINRKGVSFPLFEQRGFWMKISITFLLFSTLGLQILMANNGYGQGLDDELVTLEVKSKFLPEVLKEIEKQTNYRFAYNADQIAGYLVDLDLGKRNLGETLDLILAGKPLRYKVVKDKFIVLSAISRKHEVSVVPHLSTQLMPKHILSIPPFNIEGQVTDDTGEPLIGVNIQVKGTNKGTATDFEGRFTLEDIDENAVLVVSYVGYQTKEVSVAGKSNLAITLVSDSQLLDEVVVVGYGTVKKRSLTASVSRVENKKLDEIPSIRPENALIGRMAGINITQTNTSSPGAAPEIIIRGTGSISAGNSPLIVIDGFPGGNFNDVSMNDISSIEVLKDASSTAIYGSRGSGGVIIITTKRGESGKPVLNFNSHVGINNAIKYGKDAWVPGGQEYYDFITKYVNRDFAYTGGDVNLPPEDPERPATYRIYPVAKEGNHIWEDILLKPRLFQNYSVSVSGGNDLAKFFVSGNIKEDKGVLQETGFKQYSVRSKIDMDITPGFKIELLINPSYTQRRLNPSSITELIKLPPFISPNKLENGLRPNAKILWGQGATGAQNPLDVLEGSHYYNTTYGALGLLNGSLKLYKALVLRSSLGIDVSYSTDERFQELKAVGSGLRTGQAADYNTINWVNENILEYQNTFLGAHDITAIMGQSLQYNITRSANMYAQNGSFTNDIIHTLNNAIVLPTSSTSKSHWGLASMFLRVNYGYEDKYLLSASMRRDGSSRFGPENRWGYFPSVSAAWRISEESFLNNSNQLSELKLRGSYGIVGNFNIGDFQYLGGIGSAPYSPNGKLIQGQAMVSFGNEKLAWEKTKSFDIGLDIGLWNNRMYVSLDYYNKRTNDLLYNVSIPSVTGFQNTITNVGDIKNKGFEVELTSRNLVKDLTWNTSFNFSHNTNEVVRLGTDNERVINQHSRGMSWILEVGQPIFSYFGYVMEGVLQTQRDLERYPIIPGQLLGSVRYKDLNEDGKIDQDDRTILGNYLPKYILGMVNEFSWKNFDLDFTLQSSLGSKIYDYAVINFTGILRESALKDVVENEWFSESDPGDGQHPAMSINGLNFIGNNNYLLENSSFLALRNVNLGYNFNQDKIRFMRISHLRIYLSVSNAWMLTSKEFRGLNPESRNGVSGIGSLPGYLGTPDPMNRIFVAGVNMSF